MKRVQEGDEAAFAELGEKVGGFSDEMLENLEKSGVLKDLGAEAMAENLKKTQKEVASKESPATATVSAPTVRAETSYNPLSLSNLIKPKAQTNLQSLTVQKQSANQTSASENAEQKNKKTMGNVKKPRNSVPSLLTRTGNGSKQIGISDTTESNLIVGATSATSAKFKYDLFSEGSGQENSRKTDPTVSRKSSSVSRMERVRWGDDITFFKDKSKVSWTTHANQRYLKFVKPIQMPPSARPALVVRLGVPLRLDRGSVSRGVISWAYRSGKDLRVYLGGRKWPVVNKAPYSVKVNWK